MPSPATAIDSSKVDRMANASGCILIGTAVVVLAGWKFHDSFLTTILTSVAGMKPNTAVAFLIAGLALLRRNHRDLPFYSIGVLGIGLSTLIEYVTDFDFGIDQLLFPDSYSVVHPGRMSDITAVGFTLLGPALALMRTWLEVGRRISRGLAIVVGAIGIIVLLGYSYDTQALYQVVRPHTAVTLHTAIIFVVAAVGVLCANPAEGLVAHICADTAGALMLRWLLPMVLLITYFLGFTGWIAHKRLGWEMGFSLALVVASVMLCLVLLILWNARRIDREELALRESEKRFRLVANTAPVMIWMAGIDKLCNYFNQPWLKFTGRSLQAELNNGWVEAVHPDDVRACMDTYVQAFDRRESFQMQYRLRRYDGQYRWILDNGVPRFGEDGSFAGYVGSCIDITERQLAEEALAGIGHKLIEAQEKERTWIARELHDDINQRIASLAIELENWDEDLAPAGTGLHDHIRQVHQQLSQIGADIQALSYRLHSSKLEYLGLVAAAESFCKELARKHKVQIRFTHAAMPNLRPEVSLCLFRVLQEALQNAVKYSGVRHFRVELATNSGEIQLTVTDRGTGFDERDINAHRGLGLISMRERVQMVNGHFSIKSLPGHGTTVSVRVPLSVAPAAGEFARSA